MSESRTDYSLLTTVSMMVLAAVAIAGALHFTRQVMVPFVLAIFISYLVSPLVDFLRVQCRIPRPVAVAMALLVGAGLFTLMGLLVTSSTQNLLQPANLQLYQDRIVAVVIKFFDMFESRNIDIGQEQLIATLRDGDLQNLPIVNMLRTTVGAALDLIVTGVLVFIFVIYLLIGRNPNQFREGFYAQIDRKIRSYIVIKFITSATTGLSTWIILSLFGLDLALVFGVMAFLLNFIPSIGSIIATLLPLPIALIQFESGVAIAFVILLPGAVQFTIGTIVEPLVMGEGLDLHPVTILLALVFWGLLWGPVGMLLAAPITAVLRIVLGRLEITRPVAELLAGRLPANLPTSQYPVPEAKG
ncbi:MAG: AI-2E family transporter [Gemmatimonadetes bacterium]|nr:AI-2E family transporter [Gemmatimonadota bacterium]